MQKTSARVRLRVTRGAAEHSTARMTGFIMPQPVVLGWHDPRATSLHVQMNSDCKPNRFCLTFLVVPSDCDEGDPGGSVPWRTLSVREVAAASCVPLSLVP